MVLSNEDIKKHLKKGKIKIKPLKSDQIGPGSVDLTLSNEWYFFKKEYQTHKKIVDLNKVSFKKALVKKKAKFVLLKPGEMCLGKTLEKITLPSDIAGRLEGRSRYARMGLAIHITSAMVQPGSNNHQILEIVNFSPYTMKINAGMRISQVEFDELKTPTSKPYSKYGKIARKQ